MRPNELWMCPDTKPPGLCSWLSTALVMGPFEEEGIVVACDIVKVEGEDLATPGSLGWPGGRARWHVGDVFRQYVLLGPPLRKPLDRNDSPISVR